MSTDVDTLHIPYQVPVDYGMLFDEAGFGQGEVSFLTQDVLQLLPKHQRVQIWHSDYVGLLLLLFGHRRLFRTHFLGNDENIQEWYCHLTASMAGSVQVGVFSRPTGQYVLIVQQYRAVVALRTRRNLYHKVGLVRLRNLGR